MIPFGGAASPLIRGVGPTVRLRRALRSHSAVIAVCVSAASPAACSLVFPRAGLQHYVDDAVGLDAVLCGVFPRRTLESHTLSTEEAEATSRCMTDAYSTKRTAYFYVQGPGVDSELAWGMLTRSGRVMRFEYDSAPCGGPGCNERFVVRDCSPPLEGRPVMAELPCYTARGQLSESRSGPTKGWS